VGLNPRIVTADGPVLFPEHRPRRVCVVLLSGIGDVVHGLPLANDVKALDPEAEVTWVAEPAPAQVLRHHPSVDRVVEYRTRAGLSGLQALRKDMTGVHADLTLNVQRYIKSVWPTMFSGARTRIGLPRDKTRDGVRFFSTHVLPDGPWKHTQDLFLDFRWALGVPREAPVRWGLTFSEEEIEARARFYAEVNPEGRPVAALVVGSANPKKDWAPEPQAALADTLEGELGFRVVLLGGPSERERAAAGAILALAQSRPVDALGDSVRHLMTLLAGADLVIAPDTGPLHLAHALEVPVVGLFGHTNPWRVGPWLRYHDLVVDCYTDPEARPDPSAYVPKDDRMERITVNDVLAKIEVARSRYL
jgi:heptosyltransferase I